MIVTLSEDWRIRVEPMNFILEHRHVTEQGMVAGREVEGGKSVWKTLGYYSGFESALRAIPDHLAQLPEVETLEGYFTRWKALAKEIGGRFGK